MDVEGVRAPDPEGDLETLLQDLDRRLRSLVHPHRAREVREQVAPLGFEPVRPRHIEGVPVLVEAARITEVATGAGTYAEGIRRLGSPQLPVYG